MNAKICFKLNLFVILFFLIVGCNSEVKSDLPKETEATAVIVPAVNKYIPFGKSNGVTRDHQTFTHNCQIH